MVAVVAGANFLTMHRKPVTIDCKCSFSEALNRSKTNMNYLLKILIPLGLGILAGFVNFMILQKGAAEIDFVTVETVVERGKPIQIDNLKKLSVSDKFSGLVKSMVPWSDRGALSGKLALRKIEEGDPVFFADTDNEGGWLDLKEGEKLFPVNIGDLEFDSTLVKIGNQISFRISFDEKSPKWIGPYRVVAVGSRSRNDEDGEGRSRQSNAQSIGIAHNPTDPKILELEAFCDKQRKGEAQMLGVLLDEPRKSNRY